MQERAGERKSYRGAGPGPIRPIRENFEVLVLFCWQMLVARQMLKLGGHALHSGFSASETCEAGAPEWLPIYLSVCLCVYKYMSVLLQDMPGAVPGR